MKSRVMVVFIFEKPRSACDTIKKSRSISVRLMTIKCNSGASTPTIQCCDFDKTGAQYCLFKIFGRRTAPNFVLVTGLRFYVTARPKYMEPTLAKKWVG